MKMRGDQCKGRPHAGHGAPAFRDEALARDVDAELVQSVVHRLLAPHQRQPLLVLEPDGRQRAVAVPH